MFHNNVNKTIITNITQSKRDFQENFAKNFAKIEIQKSKLIVNLDKKPHSKFQVKILKNVGWETFLVTAIG